MAEFDKINIDAVSYNVKDTTARQQIADEITAREHADTQLQQAITAEQNARKQAITAEQTAREQAITAEQTAREQADKKLQNDIDKLHDVARPKKYLFVGDSYSMGEGAGVSPGMGWAQKVPQILGLATGDYYKACQGGYGFSRAGYKFADLVTSVLPTIPAPTEITDIYVFGGYNDNNYTGNTITADIASFAGLCKTNFPNAIVHIGMIAWSPDRQTRANIVNNVMPAYAACGESNCAYLPGCEQIMHNYTLFSSDNIHPNDAGYQLLAGAIVSAIKTGAYAAQFAYNSIELTPAGIATKYSWGGFSECIYANTWTLAKADDNRLTVTCASQTIKGDTKYSIGTLSTKYGRPYDIAMACQAMTTGYVVGDGGFHKINCQLMVKGTDLSILNVTLPDTGAYVNLTGVTQIALQIPTFTMCSLFV